jgi:hypothetical protein
MMHTNPEIDMSTQILKATTRIVWGSILLCAFINLVLLAHAVFFAVGLMSIMALSGFFTLTVQFHIACIVTCGAAMSFCWALSYIDEKLAHSSAR